MSPACWRWPLTAGLNYLCVSSWVCVAHIWLLKNSSSLTLYVCIRYQAFTTAVGGDALKKGQRRRLMVLVLWIPWVDLWWPSTIILRDINIKLWPVVMLHKWGFHCSFFFSSIVDYFQAELVFDARRYVLATRCKSAAPSADPDHWPPGGSV